MSTPGENLTPDDDDQDGGRAAQRAAARRAADGARRVLAAIVASGAPTADLDAAAATLTELADRLEPHAPGSRYAGADPIDGRGRSADSPFRAFESHPIVGPANALAPPLVLAPRADDGSDDGSVVVTATYGPPYEGPPGCVHGGMLAAAFDYVHAAATMAAGLPTLTGSLTVRYRRATPLHREVRYEGRIDRIEGRRVHVYATAIVDGEITCESEGVFVAVDPDRFRPVARRSPAPTSSATGG
jgi:acyl-coenzyme A thioesterase PaaI-like protein